MDCRPRTSDHLLVVSLHWDPSWGPSETRGYWAFGADLQLSTAWPFATSLGSTLIDFDGRPARGGDGTVVLLLTLASHR